MSEDATGSTDDADSDPDPDSEHDGTTAPDAAEKLLARIAEHDEALAEDVRRIIERGAELHDAAADLETALDERDEDVAALQDEVERLETELDEREATIEDLETELDERETEIEDLEDRLRRKQADFQNYKKRAERERERIQQRATKDLVERLLDVRDNLRRATEEDDPDVDSLRDGVEMTLREFDRVLDDEDVAEIAPAPGDEIDPTRHEVMLRTDSDQPADTVAEVYDPGYEMAGEVLRPARVTVSTGPSETDDASDESDTASVDDE